MPFEHSKLTFEMRQRIARCNRMTHEWIKPIGLHDPGNGKVGRRR